MLGLRLTKCGATWLCTVKFLEPVTKRRLQIDGTNICGLVDELDTDLLWGINDLLQHFSILKFVRLEWSELFWELPGSFSEADASRLSLSMAKMLRQHIHAADVPPVTVTPELAQQLQPA